MRKVLFLFISLLVLGSVLITNSTYAKPISKSKQVNFKSYNGSWVDKKMPFHDDVLNLGNFEYNMVSLSFIDGQKAKIAISTVYVTAGGSVFSSSTDQSVASFNSKGVANFVFEDTESGIKGKGVITLQNKSVKVTLTHMSYEFEKLPRVSTFKGTKTFGYKYIRKNGGAYSVIP